MYLKAVEIQGFKSFPAREYIEFHPGITAIVGPNGCGKSNVTDAVRWVLGEQSAKSMRGSKMQDVIFNGTTTRRAMSSAEVSIYFDNSDYALNVDFDTVIITRRYYQSGESEYLLNQKNVRLKDITELLADTGIGKDGYSIIEQGRVDEILSDRSEDRRNIFDEAAGIVKYKMRKKEAERKLAQTDNDLTRLDDITREIVRQLKPLSKQANEAIEYKEISSEARNLDIYLSVLDIESEESAEKKRAEYLRNLIHDIEELEKEREELYIKRNRILEERQVKEDANQLLNKHFHECTKKLSDLAEERALNKERERSAEKRLEDIRRDIDKLNLNFSNMSEKLESRENHRELLVQREEEISMQLLEREKEYKKLEDRLSEQEKEVSSMLSKQQNLRETLFERRSNLFASQSEYDNNAQRLIELDKAERTEGELLEDLESNKTKSAETFSEVTNHYNDALLEQQSLDDEYNKLVADIDILNKRIKETEQIKTQGEYQLSTLKRLEENREGYHQAVKAISREAEENPRFGEGLLGPVAELVYVEEEYEIAVETALGGSLHNLVTTDSDVASRLIDWLKNNRQGRETFLPLDHIEARTISDSEYNNLQGVTGFLGTIDEFISCKEELIASHLGGRIILADNLDNAKIISNRTNKRLRIVTLQGDVVNPGGSMTGGFTSRGLSGLISRSREIEELETNLNKIDVVYKNDSNALITMKDKLEDLILSINKHKELLQELQELKRDAEETVKLETIRIEERKPQLDNLRREKDELEKRQQEIKASEVGREQEIDELQNQQNELTKTISKFRGQDQSERNLCDELRNTIIDLKVTLGSTKETIKGLDEIKAQLLEDNKRQGEEIDNLKSEQERLVSLISSCKQHKTEFEELEKELNQELSQIQAELNSLKGESEEDVTSETELFNRLEQIGSNLNSMEAEKARTIAQQERIEEKVLIEKNRIWEEYRLSYNQAKELFPTLNPKDKSKARLKTLKNKMKTMPAVNHSAPEDYEELKERYTLMEEQKADVLKSREQIFRVIEELESAMREQFTKELEAINRDFQITFERLFSGGTATISPGEGDLLECDIEIKAQPPGKRLQNLTLLSGGERALTAIALVFAIFSQKPAPFCFLDEVDSALDDSNVIRFANFVHNYTKNTQFIVVTHRKGTMEAAHRLYGVTMKERGVSSILSMELEESTQYAIE